MSCIQDETLLERYLDGELSDAMALRVQAALEACDHCRTFVQDMETIRMSLRASLKAQVDAAPLDDLWDKIEPRLGEQVHPVHSSNESPWVRFMHWARPQLLELSLGATAAIAAIIVGSWIINAPGPSHKVAQGIAATEPEIDNTLIVESLEFSSGHVAVHSDPENKMRPTVFWHYDEKDGS